MSRIILSATVGEGTPDLRFRSGINILCGQNAEDVLLTLAGIFGGMPTQNGKAEILWGDAMLFVSIADGTCTADTARGGNAVQLVKNFHKQRFWGYKECTHILDGARLTEGASGATNLLLKKLETVTALKDDRPLFVINFLERLDEAVDLQPIFDALNATGRQVFIAVPNYNKEVQKYGTSMHCESNFRHYI